jgi:hypothetical protein
VPKLTDCRTHSASTILAYYQDAGLFGVRDMRFEVRQLYNCVEDGRRAVVAQVRNEGREGLLLFSDTGGEEWLDFREFQQGKWQLLADALTEA